MRFPAIRGILVVTLLTGACADGATGPTETTRDWPREWDRVGDDNLFTAGAMARPNGAGARVSRADVQRFDDPSQVVGSSHLARKSGGVRLQLRAGGLAADNAATLWVVVFNNPEACVGECDDPDLFENPATQADLLYAGGDIANAQGKVNYGASIGTNDPSASIMPLFGLPAWGILDSSRAEIHFVIRDHGPRIPGLATAQTTTFNGGCQGFGPEFGTPGPNTCTEPYFASHYAPVN